ncbi:MAG TPA: translation elongation factor Ts [Spirochaetota bacterium]|nr:translation elongation factor Ts [Spirochaetota bacterium]
MAKISATDVQELRQKTGIGMMDCKKALTDSNGDKEKALKILKEKGMAVAAKRADKQASEGIIHLRVTDDLQTGYMIQIGCETDFVAKNKDFLKLAQKIGEQYVSRGESFINSDELKTLLTEGSAVTGEKIEVAEHVTMKAEQGFISGYLHSNKKIGVLTEIKCPEAAFTNEKVIQLGKDICMQIAAMHPLALSPADIKEEQKEEQKQIFLKQMENSGKPPEILEKIVTGKLNKYFSEKCLLEMPFVKDTSLKIKQLVKNITKETGFELEVKAYNRLQLGE